MLFNKTVFIHTSTGEIEYTIEQVGNADGLQMDKANGYLYWTDIKTKPQWRKTSNTPRRCNLPFKTGWQRRRTADRQWSNMYSKTITA